MPKSYSNVTIKRTSDNQAVNQSGEVGLVKMESLSSPLGYGCRSVNMQSFRTGPNMRDRRFVAVHRGGPLDKPSHVFLTRWAADCAEEVLHLFQQHSTDERPEKAIEIDRNWASGSVQTGVAMKASLASHTAARETKEKAAIAAARAAGQAVATAHCADHSMGALLYAVKAMEAAGLDPESILQKRLAKLPDHLREQVTSGINIRLKKLGINANLQQ